MASNPVRPVRSLTVDKQLSDNTATLLCHGRLISDTTSILKDAVHALIPPYKVVVLDLTDLVFMDSSGLGTIVGLYLHAKRSGAQLRLVNLNTRVKGLLRITHLASIFDAHGE